jgi:hypothetical protein
LDSYLEHVFKNIDGSKNLDYVSCWFFKAAEFIDGNVSESAFVSTNSICQGEQVILLWSHILKKNVEIRFAYQSFKWENNAKGNAGVMCIIVGLSGKKNKKKYLYAKDISREASNINAYLLEGENIFIERRSKPLSNLALMPKGNMPYDGGFLSLTKKEKDDLILNHPASKKIIKKLIGAKEFIQGLERWCLWISDENLNDSLEIPFVKQRIESVREMRLASIDLSAKKLADRPHQFREINVPNSNSIIIPSATSERRDYIYQW